MSLVQAHAEFARKLGLLEGQDFEDEVCAFLRRSLSDFQNVPAKPHGDAGLDGLSNGQSVAYCCYGPEQLTTKLKGAALAKDIIKKFRADMRWLFELEAKGKGKNSTLCHAPNPELKTIIAPGKKIALLRLVVSVFDSHRVLGPLNAAFNDCLNSSTCSYFEKTASLTVWGPRELSTMGTVDDTTVLRLEQRALLKRVSAVLATPPAITPPPSNDFDAKFDWIEAHGKPKAGAVASLRAHFMKRWLEALAIENELANNAVELHRLLASARETAAIDAQLSSATECTALSLLENMRLKLTARLEEHFGMKLTPELRVRLVDGEVAKLIGECPMDWRS